MAEVTIKVGDRHHLIACRDGEEEHARLLGGLVADRWAAANRAASGMGGERAMLFVALMLADALHEAEHRPPTPGSASPATLALLADRLEGLASALEQAGPSA